MEILPVALSSGSMLNGCLQLVSLPNTLRFGWPVFSSHYVSTFPTKLYPVMMLITVAMLVVVCFALVLTVRWSDVDDADDVGLLVRLSQLMVKGFVDTFVVADETGVGLIGASGLTKLMAFYHR